MCITGVVPKTVTAANPHHTSELGLCVKICLRLQEPPFPKPSHQFLRARHPPPPGPMNFLLALYAATLVQVVHFVKLVVVC